MDLSELCLLGGFFALRTPDTSAVAPAPGGTAAPELPGGARTGTPPPAGGVPLARVYAGDTAPLTRRVDIVAARHEPPERRVAASIAQLGLAARLWSIALGAAVLHSRIPDLDPARLHWYPDRTTPDDLWLSRADPLPATAAALREAVQSAHLDPLADALRRDTRISRQLLRGNSGSALAGAVRQIEEWARGAGRPDAAARARALAAEIFTGPPLAGTVHGPRMRRRSCCLYYRAPRGGLCGDCVFDRPPSRTGG
ncbi:(2Fe-2S)-binding protein [Streptomyces sp. CAU 1734]|uniref:(2Fe-2S)-binding protein n=1 Tax=Streptomyces sp. CAU 1734 TaxID=3140360 RepID=UPI0032613CF1